MGISIFTKKGNLLFFIPGSLSCSMFLFFVSFKIFVPSW